MRTPAWEFDRETSHKYIVCPLGFLPLLLLRPCHAPKIVPLVHARRRQDEHTHAAQAHPSSSLANDCQLGIEATLLTPSSYTFFLPLCSLVTGTPKGHRARSTTMNTRTGAAMGPVPTTAPPAQPTTERAAAPAKRYNQPSMCTTSFGPHRALSPSRGC